MDVQLQELIDKIKSEGVEKAQAKAEQIVGEAQSEADSIIDNANKEAKRIVESAKEESERALQAGRDALAQAGRDLVLGLQRQIEQLFEKVTEESVGDALTGDVLEQAILKVFDSLGDAEGAALVLSDADADKLASGLRPKLAEKVKSGITITPSPRITSGFRVTVDGGAAYYNYSAKEVAESLASFLNPRLAEALKDAVSGE